MHNVSLCSGCSRALYIHRLDGIILCAGVRHSIGNECLILSALFLLCLLPEDIMKTAFILAECIISLSFSILNFITGLTDYCFNK